MVVAEDESKEEVVEDWGQIMTGFEGQWQL
jgi:hypothetical protein